MPVRVGALVTRGFYPLQVGDITILVNNAAVVHGKSLMDSDDDALLKSQHINTLGQFWVTASGSRASINRHREPGGWGGDGSPSGQTPGVPALEPPAPVTGAQESASWSASL